MRQKIRWVASAFMQIHNIAAWHSAWRSGRSTVEAVMEEKKQARDLAFQSA